MYDLHLRLSSCIEGRFTASGQSLQKGRFSLNSAFTVSSLLADGVPVPYHAVPGGPGYQTVAFDAPDCRSLIVEYKGILDGTTGRYPYVKEKTTDDVYILRSETVYYPVFALPDSEEYYRNLLTPLDHDKFRVTVETAGSRTFRTNLRETSGGVYEGHNPTFAVGDYRLESCPFGSIAYFSLGRDTLDEIRRAVHYTNAFMSRYKPAEIRDFQIVEIPAGYGSFVLPGTMFIAGAPDCRHLIHECIHTNWNPCCSGIVQRARFFDEGVTEYFTAKVLSHYGMQSEASSRASWADAYRAAAANSPETEAPIADYGAKELGGLSYSFGPLALFALEDAVGPEAMQEIMARLLVQYEREDVNFEKFRSLFPPMADPVFRAYFDSTDASRQLLAPAPSQDPV